MHRTGLDRTSSPREHIESPKCSDAWESLTVQQLGSDLLNSSLRSCSMLALTSSSVSWRQINRQACWQNWFPLNRFTKFFPYHVMKQPRRVFFASNWRDNFLKTESRYVDSLLPSALVCKQIFVSGTHTIVTRGSKYFNFFLFGSGKHVRRLY